MIKEGIIIMEDGTEERIKKCDAMYCIGMELMGYATKVQKILAINNMSREFIEMLGETVAKSLFEIAESDKKSPAPIVKRFLKAFSKETSEYL